MKNNSLKWRFFFNQEAETKKQINSYEYFGYINNSSAKNKIEKLMKNHNKIQSEIKEFYACFNSSKEEYKSSLSKNG